MAEPCETESKETLDEAIKVFLELNDLAYSDPEALHAAPVKTPVTRLDEVGAARHPVLKYEFEQTVISCGRDNIISATCSIMHELTELMEDMSMKAYLDAKCNVFTEHMEVPPEFQEF